MSVDDVQHNGAMGEAFAIGQRMAACHRAVGASVWPVE